MMTIREAKPDELLVIRELAHAIWPAAYKDILSTEQISYMLERIYNELTLRENLEHGHKFLLIGDPEPRGFAVYEHYWRNERITRIHKIYILPQLQGKGVGKQLLTYIESLAVAEKMDKISLNVNRSNKALFFYQKNGFEICGSEDIPIGNGYLMEDYIMEKALKADV